MSKAVQVTSEADGSSRERVQKHREAMRAKGYRLLTIWIPDARKPGFAEEVRQQCIALRESAAEKRYLEKLDLPDVEGWG